MLSTLLAPVAVNPIIGNAKLKNSYSECHVPISILTLLGMNLQRRKLLQDEASEQSTQLQFLSTRYECKRKMEVWLGCFFL